MNWKYFTQQWPYFKGHFSFNVNPMKFNGLYGEVKYGSTTAQPALMEIKKLNFIRLIGILYLFY